MASLEKIWATLVGIKIPSPSLSDINRSTIMNLKNGDKVSSSKKVSCLSWLYCQLGLLLTMPSKIVIYRAKVKLRKIIMRMRIAGV